MKITSTEAQKHREKMQTQKTIPLYTDFTKGTLVRCFCVVFGDLKSAKWKGSWLNIVKNK